MNPMIIIIHTSGFFDRELPVTTYVVTFKSDTLVVEIYATSEQEARDTIGRWYCGKAIKTITPKEYACSQS